VNSRDESAYRLKLAHGYLAKAQNDASDARRDDCLANAQEAVENAGQAILGHFLPIPKTHEVYEPLRALSEESRLTEPIRSLLHAALDAFRGMGMETHIRATYGDELTRTAPWELITEQEATAGLAKAQRAVEAAARISEEAGSQPSP
jgi:HEPN domain-containing protein